MKSYPIKVLAEALGTTVINGDGETLITGGVSTDTRSIPSESLFIALKGDNFDAHEFLTQASQKGAAGLLVQDASKLPEGVPAILVEDTLLGLQKLAAWYRRQLDIQVVAITGSNGKTSTKDLAKAVLSQKFKVTATKGNLNNHIGLPLSVLDTSEDDEVCVWEMGMNHPGEIEPLCAIAQPQFSIITNVGTAHIEYMGSREAIAEEKGAVGRALDEKGTLIVPATCDFVDYFRARTKGRLLIVGNGRGDIRAEALEMTPYGCQFNLVIEGEKAVPVDLPVTGRHMVSNALLAAGVGSLLGMTPEEIAKGLEDLELSSGRLRRFESRGVVVFDDTYNANPDSMAAAIDTLAETHCDGTKTVVLGKMGELGEHAEAGHLGVGELATQKGLRVVSVGSEARGIHTGAVQAGATSAVHFENDEEASKWLLANSDEGDIVLFKGSRAAAMEVLMTKTFPTN